MPSSLGRPLCSRDSGTQGVEGKILSAHPPNPGVQSQVLNSELPRLGHPRPGLRCYRQTDRPLSSHLKVEPTVLSARL